MISRENLWQIHLYFEECVLHDFKIRNGYADVSSHNLHQNEYALSYLLSCVKKKKTILCAYRK